MDRAFISKCSCQTKGTSFKPAITAPDVGRVIEPGIEGVLPLSLRNSLMLLWVLLWQSIRAVSLQQQAL